MSSPAVLMILDLAARSIGLVLGLCPSRPLNPSFTYGEFSVFFFFYRFVGMDDLVEDVLRLLCSSVTNKQYPHLLLKNPLQSKLVLVVFTMLSVPRSVPLLNKVNYISTGIPGTNSGATTASTLALLTLVLNIVLTESPHGYGFLLPRP